MLMHEPGDLPEVCTESSTALNAASNRQYGKVYPGFSGLYLCFAILSLLTEQGLFVSAEALNTALNCAARNTKKSE